MISLLHYKLIKRKAFIFKETCPNITKRWSEKLKKSSISPEKAMQRVFTERRCHTHNINLTILVSIWLDAFSSTHTRDPIRPRLWPACIMSARSLPPTTSSLSVTSLFVPSHLLSQLFTQLLQTVCPFQAAETTMSPNPLGSSDRVTCPAKTCTFRCCARSQLPSLAPLNSVGVLY